MRYVLGIISPCVLVVLLLATTPYITPNPTSDHSFPRAEVTMEGWGMNTSRDTRLYVLPDELTTVVSSDCPAGLVLVVVVCSAPAHWALRSAIRDTWASLSDGSVKVVFLLGLSNNISVESLIKNESLSHVDIIQESFLDSYNNLTIKSVFMLKWVLRNCLSFQYLMKSDDDVYLNLPPLLRILHPVVNQSKILNGHLFSKSIPVRNPEDRWYMPQYLFHDRFYPDYLSGSGYVMSHDVARRLYQAALDTPIIPMEDVFITGVCARSAGVTPMGQNGFYPWKTSINSSVITSHLMSPEELRISFTTSTLSTMKSSPEGTPLLNDNIAQKDEQETNDYF